MVVVDEADDKDMALASPVRSVPWVAGAVMTKRWMFSYYVDHYYGWLVP